MTVRTLDMQKFKNDISSLLYTDKIPNLDIVGDAFKKDFILNETTKEYTFKNNYFGMNKYRDFLFGLENELSKPNMKENMEKYFKVKINDENQTEFIKFIKTIFEEYRRSNKKKLKIGDIIDTRDIIQNIRRRFNLKPEVIIGGEEMIEEDSLDEEYLRTSRFESESTIEFPDTAKTVKLTTGKKVFLGITGVVIAGVLTYQLILKLDGVSSEEITKAAERDAMNASGCYLVNLNTQESNKIDILSCNNTTSPSSVPICTKTDKTCEGKFNPCIGGIKLPSQCSRLVVSKVSDSSKEVLSCLTNTGCSSYCDVTNFNYDPLKYMMECRNFDESVVILKMYRLLTGNFSTLKNPIVLNNISKKSIYISYGFLGLLLLILIIIKINKK